MDSFADQNGGSFPSPLPRTPLCHGGLSNANVPRKEVPGPRPLVAAPRDGSRPDMPGAVSGPVASLGHGVGLVHCPPRSG